MSDERGQWEVSFSRSERRIMLIWVDEEDPSSLEYIWDTQPPTSQPRASDTHSASEDAAARDAGPVGGDNDGTRSQVSGKSTADEQGATVPVKVAEDDAEPEYYWPNIQRYIESHGSPRPSVQCAICLQGLFHPGVCSASSRHCLEPIEVLDCNHVIGRRCWSNVAVNAIMEKKPPRCPFCRAAQHSWWWRFEIGEVDPWHRPSLGSQAHL